MKFRILLLFMLLFSTGHAQTVKDSLSTHEGKVDSLLEYASGYLGTRYGYGSTSTKSFDCSGFVMHCYGKFGVSLPHGSGAQAAVCEIIPLSEVKPGDLLFFSGRKVSKKKIGHVSMVKSVENGKITMIHATVQAGVMQEVMQESEYFKKRFIKAGRLKKGFVE